MKLMLYAKLTTIIGSIYYTPHILSSHIPHSTFYENQYFNSLPTTIQKLFRSYILVGDFTIITPTSIAIKSLKLIRVWQMKLLLISCRRRWVI